MRRCGRPRCRCEAGRGQFPDDQVAGAEMARILAGGDRRAMPAEKGGQVRYPAVVDVGVRALQRPFGGMRIGVPVGADVVVDQLLQVDAELAVDADDDVGAAPRSSGMSPLG